MGVLISEVLNYHVQVPRIILGSSILEILYAQFLIPSKNMTRI